MKKMFLTIISGLMAATAGPAVAQEPADGNAAAAVNGKEARIAFANRGGIRDWRAVNDKLIYIQGAGGKWYRAELMSSCLGLQYRDTVAFKSDPDGSFTKFSAIAVRDQLCPVSTLAESGPPPGKAKKAKSDS